MKPDFEGSHNDKRGSIVTELRQAERQKSFLKARILFNHRMTSVDCIVKNISAFGAHIAIDTTAPIPDEFELEIPMKGKTFRAEMRWRDAKGIGLVFRDQPAEAGSRHPQFAKLEQDNVRLRSVLLGLTKRLEDLGQDVPSFF